MRQNLGWIDRFLRYLGGIAFLTWAIAGGPTWTFVGLYLLFTASFGLCAFYLLLGINSQA